MWLHKCPVCKRKIDFDWDGSSLPEDEDIWGEICDSKNNKFIIKGEMWCTHCLKRYSFEEHWAISLEQFKITEEKEY